MTQDLTRRSLLVAAREVEKEVRRRLFSHVIRLPLPFFQGTPTGDVMSRLTNDLSAVWLLLGDTQMTLKDYAAAAEAFAGAAGIALGEQRYLAMSRQGQALVYAGDNEAAHTVLSALIDEGAFGFEAYGWRAYANLALGRKDEAERDFMQAVQRTTDREKRAEYEAALKAIAESR